MGLLYAQNGNFNGIGTNMYNLYKLSDAKSRLISPENCTGEKGKGGATPLEEGSAKHAARDLGTCWKVNPYFRVPSDTTIVLVDIDGPVTIQQ